MVNHQDPVETVFGALADPVRRAVLARLAHEEHSVSELAAEHSISLPAFLKHIHVLEEAGLLATRKVGRVRRCRLTPGPLAAANRWLEEYRLLWDRQLDRLERFLTESHEEDPEWTRRNVKRRVRSKSDGRSGHRKRRHSPHGRIAPR
jgi:DNA-binding transcriptional ArsR family regulator